MLQQWVLRVRNLVVELYDRTLLGCDDELTTGLPHSKKPLKIN